MVVRIVYARRIPREWNKRIIHALQSITGQQQQFWMHVQTMWKYARGAADRNPKEGTTITITSNKLERENETSDIEFLIIDISNPDDAHEELELQSCLRMFDRYGVFKKFYDTKIPESNFYNKPLKSRYFNIDAMRHSFLKKQKEAGERVIGQTSISSLMLRMGIMCHVGRYASLEDAETAFIKQEDEFIKERIEELKTPLTPVEIKVNTQNTEA